MMSVRCASEEVKLFMSQLASDGARVACYNSPTSSTNFGDEDAIDELQALVEAKQIFNMKLQVSVNYHMYVNFTVSFTTWSLSQKAITPKSNPWIYPNPEPSYWVENPIQFVRFSDAVTSMCQVAEYHKASFNTTFIAAEAAQTPDSNGQVIGISFNKDIKEAQSLEEAPEIVYRGLLNKLPSVLMLETEAMDVTRPLWNSDMNSLTSIEVRLYHQRVRGKLVDVGGVVPWVY
ncbi:hypothetical protein BJ878DRAFT_564434 [Calycina marina]|uniref:Uncharacterized protein n=1 Tax=Calycina marina TaxID=1763456 RepID=A0A9P8CI48_9HELO|nr:hypothetical protein BJ878DRAFT_564434 [Calycina marina]